MPRGDGKGPPGGGGPGMGRGAGMGGARRGRMGGSRDGWLKIRCGSSRGVRLSRMRNIGSS